MGLATLAVPPYIGVQAGAAVSLPMAIEPLVAVAVTTRAAVASIIARVLLIKRRMPPSIPAESNQNHPINP